MKSIQLQCCGGKRVAGGKKRVSRQEISGMQRFGHFGTNFDISKCGIWQNCLLTVKSKENKRGGNWMFFGQRPLTLKTEDSVWHTYNC